MDFDHSELLTIKDYIRWGASRFADAELSFSHGMSSPFDEAAYLVLHTLYLPVDTPDLYFDSRLTRSERDAVAEIIQQRVETRKPAAYITHEGWFLGLPFYVDENVLIPRSPIAEYIEKQFAPWIEPHQVHHILDLCTGSGCIGIACAYAFPHARVDLGDISAEALEVARINIERHNLAGQVEALESDLFDHLQGHQYDIIVSNPPYVDAQDMAALTPEFLHEPAALALASGDDGLDHTRRILRDAAKHLTDHGILVVEVGNSQYALQAAYPDVLFHWLEFERGGDGVFLLTADQVRELAN
ncbi:50S ribosomal protein L3 N(5)-glutamine methyltransferase [Thiothrix lacustris]|uniref:50S ribosomal protein L3 N(5)-glutamine methyltransferase n=1 Tax=Thiothrix lacustris TaxID=525917 RepID=UPI0027E57383|nr:50S ribosomal protein L3 N(5)-glutamine methyltransferase [Thiothrix lacustris]WMP17980.1 50S ribosomal protein L3 N(5)-glutamine methyltransferase [Thiothrix lacustris]